MKQAIFFYLTLIIAVYIVPNCKFEEKEKKGKPTSQYPKKDQTEKVTTAHTKI